MPLEHLDRHIGCTIPLASANPTNVLNALNVAASVSAPIVKVAVAASGLPGINIMASTIESIFQVAQQIRWNKKQSVRLAREARKSFDALKNATAQNGEVLIGDSNFMANVESFACTLSMIEERFGKITRETFFYHLLHFSDLADELTDLERECRSSRMMFMMTTQIDMFGTIQQSEQDRKEDRVQYLKELGRIKADTGAMLDLFTGKEGKLNQNSINDLQVILHKIDNQPEKVPPVVREFAEEATKTLKVRTNVDLPRRPPWLVSAREFQRGEKIGEGKNSVACRAIWKKSNMEIVLKDLKDRDKIEGLVEDIVRWRDLEHPFLHTFLGARPVGLPRFFIYKHMRHGNVLEYLRHNHLAHRELLLLQVSLGMDYLHRSSIVHGNLRCHNILIDDQGNALVGDFGISKHFPENHRIARTSKSSADRTSFHTSSITGSLFWLAPECIDAGLHTYHSDSWSFSISSFELLTGGMNPLRQFREEDVWQELTNGYRPPRPSGITISDHVWEIICRCWFLDPVARPSFASIAVALGLSLQVDERCLKFLNELLNRQGSFKLLGDPSMRITQIIKDVIPQDLGQNQDSLLPREAQILQYCLQILSITSPAPWEKLLEAGVLGALLVILQSPSFVGAGLLSQACTVLAGLIMPDSPYLKPHTTTFTKILRSLVAILKSNVEDSGVVSTLFIAISAVVLAAPPGESAVRSVIDACVISRITSAISSKTDPTLVERGLEVIRALGGKRGTLKPEDVSSISPVLANVMCSAIVGVKFKALSCMEQLLTASPDQAQVVRQSVNFRVLIPVWEKWESNENTDPTLENQASIVLAELPAANCVGALLELIEYQIQPAFKKAICRALVLIGQRADAESRTALAQRHNVISHFSGLLTSCNDDTRPGLYEVIAAFSSSNDLPTAIVSLSAMNFSDKDVGLRMLLGIVRSMDEDAKSKEILTSEALIHLVGVLISAGATPPGLASRGGTFPFDLVDLALDVMSGLLHDVSSEFLENTTESLLALDAHLALAALLNIESVPTRIKEKTLSFVATLASSTDDAKIIFLQSPILPRLRDIIGSKTLPSTCRDVCCIILRHLLSIEDRQEEDEEVIVQVGLSPALILHIEDPKVDGTLSARVLSMLIPLFGPDVSYMSIGEAVNALDAYCARSLEQTETVFASRQYTLVDYVRHPISIIRVLGLRIALAFLKGNTDQRRAITSLNGFRADIENAQSRAITGGGGGGDGDWDVNQELVSIATEVLDRWKSTTSRRRG